MKKKTRTLTGLLLSFLAVAMLITACDKSTDIGNIEESMSSVPHLNLVDGAENVVATVNKDKNRSNYSLTLEGMKDHSILESGTYQAFCAIWDVPINSDNSLYGNVKIHSIQDEPYWDGINYLINKLDAYYDTYEDLSWLEVQIAMWSIMDHKKFDLNTIPESDLPSYVRDGGYNSALIEKILDDVETNKKTFEPTAGGAVAYYAEIPDAQDQIIIHPGYDIEKIAELTFLNFAKERAVGMVQKVGGNTTRQSIPWAKNGTTDIIINVFEPASGSIGIQTKVTGGSGTSNINSTSNMPAGCTFEEMDRVRVQVIAEDEDLEIKLTGNYMGITESITVKEGVTPDNKVDVVIPNIDFSLDEPIELQVEFDGPNRSSDDTSRIELHFGCSI